MINPIFVTLRAQQTALAGSVLAARFVAMYSERLLARNLSLTEPADVKQRRAGDTRATQARPPCGPHLVDQYGRRRRDVNVERL